MKGGRTASIEGCLSKEGCRGTSKDGRLARLKGLEKLKAGRGIREPPIEYSELRDGERPCIWAKGGKGEFGIEKLLLEDSLLSREKPDSAVEALCSSSELSTGIDLMLACFTCGDLGGARDEL